MTKSQTSRTQNIIAFPGKLVTPVGVFLKQQLKHLERNRKKLVEEDPFSDTRRVIENAAPDTEAEEQFGHARTRALRESLDRKIVQTRKALARIWVGKYGICEECGNMIDTERLMIRPEATLCIKCEAKKEKQEVNA
jgi:DnaK suppressor protein